MVTTVPYSVAADLLIGDLPLPSYVSADKYVLDAADQIDSVIGNRYQTPLDLSDTSDIGRPSRLLIKRISNLLASGRILLALDQSGEQGSEHAYGLSLLRTAESALQLIASGQTPLVGAEMSESYAPAGTTQMSIVNVDAVSAVEAFYQETVDRGPYGYPGPRTSPIWFPGNSADGYASRG